MVQVSVSVTNLAVASLISFGHLDSFVVACQRARSELEHAFRLRTNLAAVLGLVQTLRHVAANVELVVVGAWQLLIELDACLVHNCAVRRRERVESQKTCVVGRSKLHIWSFSLQVEVDEAFGAARVAGKPVVNRREVS